MVQEIAKKWGKHIAAIAIFTALVVVYFSPAVLDGKVIKTVDMTMVAGMGNSQMEKYAETAEPGEFSVWSDAMFSGMPFVAQYGNPAPDLPGYDVIERPVKGIGYLNAGMVLAGLICFYLFMCVLGVNWWIALAGAIAYALGSYNIIIIAAGHITKAYVIAYMPIVLAGIVLLFKRKYIWGGVLFLLGVALSVGNSHIQITYYLMLLCLFVYVGYLIRKIKEKEIGELLKVTAIMAVCVLIAVLPNARILYVQWEWGKTSIRGATELTTTTASGEKISSGLDKDYAFQWSYGKGELLTLLIPDVYGGSSTYTLDNSSEFYNALRKGGYQVSGKSIQAPAYWGDKPFTSGPVYAGAIVCFLFILGMFVVNNRMKWWLFAGAVFLTFMALGRNMDWFNDVLFHYLPMYNKFRTPEMALVIPCLVMPLIAFWGLKEIIDRKVEEKLLKQGLIWSLAITGGICLVIWLFPSAFLSFQSTYDAQFQAQPWYSALLADRASLASSDAFRSLLFIILAAGLVFLFTKSKKPQTSWVVCAGIALLILIDLWQVDRRYLNDDNYTTAKPVESYTMTTADQEILKDPAVSYRVANLNNTFNETNTSYYHHSIGGYHAAKLRRYQELVEHRLAGELSSIIKSFSAAKSMEDIQQVLEKTPSLNMFNTRYIIYNPDAAPIINPYAYGNAWFVQEIEIAANADAEMEALNRIDPLKTAIVDQRFSGELAGFSFQPDSTATITLDKYRPNRLTYTSHTATEQLAVFSEMYYQPGWSVTIDGQPAAHFRADWTLRAMRIPAGKHEIVFEHRPQGYVTAANVSVYSSFLILLLLIGAIGYSVWSEWKKVKE